MLVRRSLLACLLSAATVGAASQGATAIPAGDRGDTSGGSRQGAQAVPFTSAAFSGGSTRTVARRTKPVPVVDGNAVRVAMNKAAITDAAGSVWAPVPASVGTRDIRTFTGQVRGTNDRGRYAGYAVAPRGYLLPVLNNGTYRVTLSFVEPSATAPGQRVFDIVGEDAVLASDVDIFARVGAGAAYDLTLDVPVRDKELTLRFVPKVGTPLVSAIEVSAPAGGAVVEANPAQAVRFAPTNVWTRSIRTAPLAANSAAVGANVAKQVADHWGGTAAVNAYEYNVALNVAPAGTPRITVGFFDCQKKGSTPAELYSGPAYFANVPVPADAVASKGTDGHMSVYDPASDKLWDFWQMRRSATTGGWEACWGGRIDNVSASIDTAFPKYTGASASGLAIVGGAITVEEAKRGRITHAIDIGVLDVRNWQYVSWPANRSDGITEDVNAPWEGQRLRLDPSLDLSTLNLTPFGRMVAEAAQEYGFIVCDRSGAVGVTTTSALKEQQVTGSNPWGWLLGGPAYNAMSNFPWDRLQALPPSYGK